MTRVAIESTAQPTKQRMVSGLVQPMSGARVSPKTKRIRPAVIVTAPAASKCRSRPSARLSRTNRGTKSSASNPIGTLTKKIHSQPAYSVSTPPRMTPIAAPDPAIAPSTPSALFRSAPSSNVTSVIEKTEGERTAPAAPWQSRNTTSAAADHARPQSSENSANKRRPAMKTLRRPSRSPERPPSRRKPPKVRA